MHYDEDEDDVIHALKQSYEVISFQSIKLNLNQDV